jgi:hypothetical protein
MKNNLYCKNMSCGEEENGPPCIIVIKGYLLFLSYAIDFFKNSSYKLYKYPSAPFSS